MLRRRPMPRGRPPGAADTRRWRCRPATSAPGSAGTLAAGDYLKERFGSEGRVSELDGLSVDADDWHFNVRPSNTEPLLRLNLESLVSRDDMEAKRDEVLALIRA